MSKKLIIIIGAAVVLILVVSAVVVGIHRNAEAETEFLDDKDRMGIDYGGSFDESNPTDVDDRAADADWDENQTEPDSEYDMDKTPDELKEELEKRREESGFGAGRIKDGSTETNKLYNEADTFYEDFVDDDFIDDDFEENGEEVEVSDLGIDVIMSTGYAENEVLCDADSREEAERVAAQISGTLLSWEHGVATIRIEGSVDDLLESLEQQGSSLNLYRNFYY